jgi:hypothetical protein
LPEVVAAVTAHLPLAVVAVQGDYLLTYLQYNLAQHTPSWLVRAVAAQTVQTLLPLGLLLSVVVKEVQEL